MLFKQKNYQFYTQTLPLLHDVRTDSKNVYNITCNVFEIKIKMKGDGDMKNLKDKTLVYSLGNILTTFALMVTTLNVNTTCAWVAHQEELPETAKKLRKF